MAQNAAQQEEGSSASETELEFVTADFAELCAVGFGLVSLVALVAGLTWYLVFYVPAEDARGRRGVNYTRLLEESVTRSVAPCDNFYRFVCTGWIRDHSRGQHRSVADTVQREALLDARDAFEEAARNRRRRGSTGRTLSREVSSEVENADGTRRDVEGRLLRDHHRMPLTSSAQRHQATAPRGSAVLKAASLFDSCKEVVDKKKSETKKVAEFMKTYTKFPTVEPQDAADAVAATIELSLTWRIDTLFIVNVFADLDEGGRPTVEIAENVELFQWFRWRNVLKDSGRLEEFFLSHLQAIPGFRSSRDEYLLTEIADADSQVIPSLRTDEAVPDDPTYHNLSELIPGVAGQTWVDEINRQTEPYFKVEADHKLRLDNVHYLQQVGRILNHTGKPLLVPMFVGWTVLRQLAPRASYKAATVVYKDTASYVDACFSNVAHAMPLAASYPYLSKLPTARMQAVARTMVNDVRRELAATFANVPWMDNATRAAAGDKLAAMAEVLVKPAFLVDEGALDAHYANFSTHDDYLTASLQTARSSTRLVMAKLSLYRDGGGHGIAIEDLAFPPLTVNALYDRALNAMVVPAGIMRPPYLDDGAWTAFNYAGLGAVVAHELMHGFDARGRERDASGALRDWWSADVRKRYEDRAACLRRAYNVGRWREAQKPSASAYEDVADFASLRVVLGAYRRRAFLQQRGVRTPASFLEFSGEQLFYLNYCFKLCSADEDHDLLEGPRTDFATDEDRCNVPLRHLKEFADAFRCAKGDPMDVMDKCSFWDLPVEQLRMHEDAMAESP
ncbi:neprilysin-1-like [Dermacentor albipictus]|uniref:neprilysin-1-like n=1 Tax=Dermacentor albipictus TaxID=60249 RepID=UPI0038FC3D60